MKIQLCEIKSRTTPKHLRQDITRSFGEIQSYPNILVALIEGKKHSPFSHFGLGELEISLIRNYWDNGEVSLRSAQLTLNENIFIYDNFFKDNKLVGDENHLEFDYTVLPDVNKETKHWKYQCVYMPFADHKPKNECEKEKTILEDKIKQTYQHTLASFNLHHNLKNIGLELIWSDEDIGMMPFIVIPGTRNSKGIVATNFEGEKMDFLSGKITVHQPKYLFDLREVYARLQKYGFSPEVDLAK